MSLAVCYLWMCNQDTSYIECVRTYSAELGTTQNLSSAILSSSNIWGQAGTQGELFSAKLLCSFLSATNTALCDRFQQKHAWFVDRHERLMTVRAVYPQVLWDAFAWERVKGSLVYYFSCNRTEQSSKNVLTKAQSLELDSTFTVLCQCWKAKID